MTLRPMKKLLRAFVDPVLFLLIWVPCWLIGRAVIPRVWTAKSERFDLIRSVLLEFKSQRGTRRWPAIPVVLCDLTWKTREYCHFYHAFGKKFAMVTFYLPEDATREEIREKLHPLFGPREEQAPVAPQDE